uniref:Tetratricopeptide repeat protein 5 OB fold domain-containing protein n=1 Tax=Acrobeloides nanus TaxID=290746 RepID=A0A914DRM6_9BILA
MDELNKKVNDLNRMRYEYFLSNPTTSQDSFKRVLRLNTVQLVEEIPINIDSHLQNFIHGRILNICVDYDPICEDHLEKALKLKEDSEICWLELGKCKWKKSDTVKAYDCFRTAYNIIKSKRTDSYDCLLYSKILGHLSAALRSNLVRTSDKKLREAFIRESVCLCEEAVNISPDYGFGWYSLGNAYICRFFSSQNPAENDLDLAIDSYQKALSIDSPPFISADLHVNYSTALKYKQRYAEAIQNLHRALQIEPHFIDPKQRLQSITSFLLRLNEAILRKGKIPNKRFKEMISLLSKKDLGVYSSNLVKIDSNKESTKSNFSTILAGENPDSVVCGKVLAIIPNEEQIPYTFVGADSDGNIIGITVYNCSPIFGFIIGDSFAIPEPKVIEIKDLKLEDKIVNCRMIRVMNPLRILKNGKKFGKENYAFANMQISVNDSTDL